MIEDKRKIVTQILGSYHQKGDEHLYHCPYCGHHKKKMSNSQWRKRRNKKKMRRKWLEGIKRGWGADAKLLINYFRNKKPNWW